MPDIIVVHGYAGAGKSTHCEHLAGEGIDGRSVHHVSAGNRLRAIRGGTVSSYYTAIVNAPDAPSPLPDTVVDGVIFEAIEGDASLESLILIDGYPRHPTAVEAFHASLERRSHNLLGTIAMTISLETSIARVLSRGQRSGEKIKGDSLKDFARNRYALDRVTTNLAIDALARFAPVNRIVADEDTDKVFLKFRSTVSRILTG